MSDATPSSLHAANDVAPDLAQTKWGRPQFNQAAKICAKFGGPAKLAELLDLNRITPYRWSYRRPYGRDGLVPSSMVDRINRAAAGQGVTLTAQDWLPERNAVEDATPTDHFDLFS